jgi:hypothetical protein
MGGVCSTHGIAEKYVENFSPETWKEETTWRLGRRWEDNIKINSKQICESFDWIKLANTIQWRAPFNTVINLRVPQKGKNLLISWATTGFSKMTIP